MGYLFALIMGITLGLVGAGGSLLTIPVLVYVSGIPAVMATSYSLFIVGTTALVGALEYWKRGLLHLKTAIVFVLPSLATVLVVRKTALPMLPDPIFQLSTLTITKNQFLMIVFALFMIVAAYNMIRAVCVHCDNNDLKKLKFNYPLIVLIGAVGGALTGFLGAGGGFLIVPSLVLMANLPLRYAVGTSLLIIALNSLIGFAGDLVRLEEIDWSFLLLYTSLAIFGIFIGSKISRYTNPAQLKIYFGWFVLVVAIVILVNELK